MKSPALALQLIVTVLFVAPATATELNDSSFGFQLEIPDNFTRLEIDPSERDTLYKFVDREPAPDDPAHVIQIQRLRGVISPTGRMKKSEIPVVEGIKTSLQEFT